MTSPIYALPVPWGDRTSLHPKAMVYAMSMDVSVTADGPYLTVKKTAPRVAFRHIFDEVVVTMPEGLRVDVPRGTIVGGDGEIGAPNDPTSANLRLRIKGNLGAAGPLLMDCDGVINFNGGSEAFRSADTQALGGSTFITTHNETTSATYRWLNRRQLFGMGRVKAERGPSRQWQLVLSFDLYGAA